MRRVVPPLLCLALISCAVDAGVIGSQSSLDAEPAPHDASTTEGDAGDTGGEPAPSDDGGGDEGGGDSGERTGGDDASAACAPTSECPIPCATASTCPMTSPFCKDGRCAQCAEDTDCAGGRCEDYRCEAEEQDTEAETETEAEAEAESDD